MFDLKRVKVASRALKLKSAAEKNRVLLDLSERILNSKDRLLAANLKDLSALPVDAGAAFRDRLTLSETRLHHICESLIQVARADDPTDKTQSSQTLKNGLVLKKVRSPLGVIFMIFESRPNVAIEAFSMGFKAGNAMILRGGKESRNTTRLIYQVTRTVLKENNFPEACCLGITDPDRKIVDHLLTQKSFIDVVVPRGGEKLIEHVSRASLIPLIKNDRGLCHIYVDQSAELKMAVDILVNAKTQRPSVCNSMETMLIHESVAAVIIPKIHKAMEAFGVTWYACPTTRRILKSRKDILHATAASWDTEYLDQMVNCRVVASLDEALAHIETYGTHHSEAIITKNKTRARRFQNEVDAASVYWNASTRFTDGFEFGLGGELGISTQKLHVRGPVGLEALTSERWVIDGTGQFRK